MAHFTLNFGPDGPVLTALVSVSLSRRDALASAGAPTPPIVTIKALVDTGASITCIDPSVIRQLGIEHIGKTTVFTPSTGNTPHAADLYDIGLAIPGPTGLDQALVFPQLPVMESHLDIQGIQGLIGRDILRDCVLVYNGSAGVYTLAF